MSRTPRVVSTLHYPRRPEWSGRVETFDRDALSRAAVLARLVRAAASCDAMVLDGAIGIRAGSPDLAAAVLAARRRHPPPIVLADCTWKPGTSAVQLAARRAGIRLMDRAVSAYCVLSTHERDRFASTWGVSADKVTFTPFYFTLADDELDRPVEHGGGVFAGGDSMRDFGPLIDAASGLATPVHLATGRRDVVGRTDLPPVVRAGRVPHARFMELMRGAGVVVVPMPPGIARSAGQQTYLNAMALGKVVVVTDSPGARDYVEHGRTGFIVPPGDAAALARVIRHVLDPGSREEMDDVRRAARESARSRFTADAYVSSLLVILDRALDRDGEWISSRR